MRKEIWSSVLESHGSRSNRKPNPLPVAEKFRSVESSAGVRPRSVSLNSRRVAIRTTPSAKKRRRRRRRRRVPHLTAGFAPLTRRGVYSLPCAPFFSLSFVPPTPALRRLHPLMGSLMAPGSSSERLDSSSTVTRRVSPSLSPTSRPSTSSPSSSSSSSCRRRRRRRRRRRSPSPSSSSPSSCWWCCALRYGVRRDVWPVNSAIHADRFPR